ncbi:MAG: DNA mismatch repair endonuclease MutL [Bacteroidetes bacterium]|nr:DNA mismatch repair endonuclease MutL [Bacteroidota bacterium]
MADLIRVLPDVVANQIAAGEVIQRPASVVKELVENAVDAGGDQIKVITKDAGKSFIQVIDNGCGMSENDARLCFERHATSKINKAEDLFAIRTMGFRGEALASIASISQLELKTKRREDESGTHIGIDGSDIQYQQPVATSDGTSIAVKNLFYNVPARRRFLKSPNTELKHIITEFQRVALCHPEVGFSLFHNNAEIYQLSPSGRRERIVQVMGRQLDSNLVNIQIETSIVQINGFIGKPEKAKKTYGEQFFFVNDRFMKHPYFHRAVLRSYESILPPDTVPSYFIFLDLDPSHVDINIHPTKTEIKFDEERAIFQFLHASIREGLGKFNITPTLDFDQEMGIEIPILRKGESFDPPKVEVNPQFNPFELNKDNSPLSGGRPEKHDYSDRNNLPAWESLYPGRSESSQSDIESLTPDSGRFLLLNKKYILTPVKSGLLAIHIRRALERINYEDILSQKESGSDSGQQLLYPEQFDLNPVDLSLVNDIRVEMEKMGFSIDSFGGNSIIVRAVPSQLQGNDVKGLIEALLEDYKNETFNLETSMLDKLARSLSKIASGGMAKTYMAEEMKALFDRLFACSDPQNTAGGKPILTILQTTDIDKRFL